ncbi:hypothetical protein COV18_03665 [Candidatus Woesearchaeota archaeon CG10_big_fil_rev_8_21_14_0_10_37_12]|nr:MAG: hypothetical protein COV18_03665 [Candidatus Woesearchaeota archaeon CG10_big_fil_rev_8_21_14_0_10_37_12]
MGAAAIGFNVLCANVSAVAEWYATKIYPAIQNGAAGISNLTEKTVHDGFEIGRYAYLDAFLVYASIYLGVKAYRKLKPVKKPKWFKKHLLRDPVFYIWLTGSAIGASYVFLTTRAISHRPPLEARLNIGAEEYCADLKKSISELNTQKSSIYDFPSEDEIEETLGSVAEEYFKEYGFSGRHRLKETFLSQTTRRDTFGYSFVSAEILQPENLQNIPRLLFATEYSRGLCFAAGFSDSAAQTFHILRLLNQAVKDNAFYGYAANIFKIKSYQDALNFPWREDLFSVLSDPASKDFVECYNYRAVAEQAAEDKQYELASRSLAQRLLDVRFPPWTAFDNPTYRRFDDWKFSGERKAVDLDDFLPEFIPGALDGEYIKAKLDALIAANSYH